MIDLKGRIAVVTGGGRGLGCAFAQALSAAGASVVLLARSKQELDQTAASIGGKARAFSVDVTDARRVTKVFREIGPVDLLVNNAGVVQPIGPFVENDFNEWWRTMEVNVRGAMLCTQAVLPGMIKRCRGRIINLVTGAFAAPNLSAYLISKTALVRASECLAAETKRYGLAVFSFAPGTVRTEMSTYSLTSPEGRRWIPWFQRIFDEGLDLPVDKPAALVVALASGRYDALTGLYLTPLDDLDALLADKVRIDQEKLHTLQIRPREVSAAAVAIASIRAASAAPLTLRLEHIFQASLEKLYRAWTDPAAISKWFIDSAAVHWLHRPLVDARCGGHFEWVVARDDCETEIFHFLGEYYELAPDKIIFSWNWKALPIEGVDAPGNTMVSVELLSEGSATKIILTHSELPTEAALAAHKKGWERCFAGIMKFVGGPHLPAQSHPPANQYR